MSFNHSTCFNPNLIPDVDELKHLMRCTDALNDSLYHTARAWNGIIAQGAEIMDAWTEAMQDYDREDAPR